MLYSTTIRIGKWSLLFKLRTIMLGVRSSGVSSRVSTTPYHIVCLDYDNVSDTRLDEELRWLQQEFKLGDFIVLESSKFGRHAFCLDILKFKDVLEIIRTSNCDAMFKRAPRNNENISWVLRFDKKGSTKPPKYLRTIKSQYEGKKLQSRSHAKYLLNFGAKIELQQPFGPEEVEIQTYNTGKRVK